MSANPDLHEYNDQAASVPEEALLGSLAWYTISDADVRYDRLEGELRDHGLRTDLLRPIRPIDAFANATKEIKRSWPTEDGIKLNVLVRPVGQDTQTVFRHIICERVNTKAGERRRLVYDASAEILYDRGRRNGNGRVVDDHLQVFRREPPGLFQALTPEQRTWLAESLDALPERFEHLRHHLSNHKIRNFVREYLKTLDAICVKESGGVYFVRQRHAGELERLSQWVQSIGSSFHITPLLDLVNQRQMLARAWEDEALSEVRHVRNEMDSILDEPARSIKESTYEDIADRAVRLASKNNEVAEMLDIRSEITKEQVSRLVQDITKLMDRIDYGTQAGQGDASRDE